MKYYLTKVKLYANLNIRSSARSLIGGVAVLMWFLLELGIASLALYFCFSQVLRPLWRGTALFPMIRVERKLEHQLTQARQEVVESDLAREVERVQRSTARRPRPSSQRKGTTASRPSQEDSVDGDVTEASGDDPGIDPEAH